METLTFIYTAVGVIFDNVVGKFEIGYRWSYISAATFFGLGIFGFVIYCGKLRFRQKKKEIFLEEDLYFEKCPSDIEIVEDDCIQPDNAIFTKVDTIKLTSPTFKPDMIGRNRHGIAVFGYEWGDGGGYSLYWSKSMDSDFFKVEGICERLDDGITTIVSSKDGEHNFRYTRKSLSMNNEHAEIILTLIVDV